MQDRVKHGGLQGAPKSKPLPTCKSSNSNWNFLNKAFTPKQKNWTKSCNHLCCSFFSENCAAAGPCRQITIVCLCQQHSTLFLVVNKSIKCRLFCVHGAAGVQLLTNEHSADADCSQPYHRTVTQPYVIDSEYWYVASAETIRRSWSLPSCKAQACRNIATLTYCGACCQRLCASVPNSVSFKKLTYHLL